MPKLDGVDPKTLIATCTSINCDERRSVCCGARSEELKSVLHTNGTSTDEFLLICSKCKKLWQGGECDAQLAEAERAYIESLWNEETGSPMGVSQWRDHGQRYGYDKYFGIKWPNDPR